ncbi:Protein NRDE2-like protein [Lachnellula occidentalis]|uniref:Protein NRDE2-like protein n=1 Tax=Lachnellula occidentalis TaxID=215460 RepID=A0A8H8RPL5_9HELO|nr:Protein NRDE2-like protein [Lachnellula occidentalis]
MSKAIPKFGSFKPNTTAPPPPSVEKEKKNRSRDNDGKEEEHRKHRHRGLERRGKHGHVTESRPEASHAARDTSPLSAETFFVDKKGDEKNLVYGSIHRYDVPAFYRIGAGGVLGAPSKLKIDRDHSDDKGIVLYDWRASRFGHREKYVFSRVERERPQLLKIRPELAAQNPEDVTSDFVSLDLVRGKKRKRTGGDDSSGSDNDDTHYRSIHGKSKARSQPTDEALQCATESESSGSEAGVKLDSGASQRQKNVELSRRVEQHPNDIDAWLALIEHQDVLLRGQDDRRRITNAETRSTAEIKIHMYEKALEKATTLKDRERLLLGLMEDGTKIWETKAQSDRREKISKENIDSLMLWRSFLDFKQGTFSTFRYEETRDICIRRIKLLSEVASRAGSDTVNSIYQQILYVFLRLTTFMREAGYSELAVAIWQGLLEVNFCAPKQATSTEESVRLFGDFWESEVPRIGDDGARGWRHYIENQDLPEVDTLVEEEENSLDNRNLFQSWATNERLRCKDAFLPARTMDDVVEDDPFRVILFPDIEQFLIILPPNVEELRKGLLDAFLLFCRLPPLGVLDENTTQSYFTDPFVRNDLLECNSAWISNAYAKKTELEGGNFDISTALDIPLSTYQSSPGTMFYSKFWFKGIPDWRNRYAGECGPVSYKWTRNTLKQVIQSHFQEDLAEYYLAFEWRNEPETIKKIAKNLLKQHPSSLRLYNAYAMIESARGNKDVADGVFSAALNMSKSMSESDKKGSILLWTSWIWVSLEEGHKSFALQHLLCMADGAINTPVEVSPTALIKTKQHLISNRDYLLSAGDTRYATIYGECLAIFEYLTANSSQEPQSELQGDIATALACYEKMSKELTDRNLSQSPSHELLLQSAARLLYHHARIGPFRPVLLRERLSRFITTFPHNTIFLSLYTWNESRLRIDNRVRTILISTVLTPQNDVLTSRLFAIYYEIGYGTIHSVRSAFEHAVNSPVSKSSAGLWKFYILYCLETQQFRSKAKDIWYRALRACPWAKELYITGFEKMGDLASFDELKGTWRVMGEKELRVHVDLEDNFDEIQELEHTGGRRRLGSK